MDASTRSRAAGRLGAALALGAWLIGCGSEPGAPPPAPENLQGMRVSGRVVKGDEGVAHVRIRFSPLTPHGYSAEVTTDPDGRWAWEAPQGRYRVEVLVDNKPVATKELDLAKPDNPDVEITIP